MNDERDRILLRRIEVRRSDDVRVNRIAVRAFERELLRLAHARGGDLLAVDVRQLTHIAAVGAHGEELHRREQRVESVDDAIRTFRSSDHRGRRDGAVFHDDARVAGGRVDREQRVLPEVVCACVESLAVGRPGEIAGRTIPRLRQHARRAVRPRAQHDAIAIRFEAGTLHREIRQRLAVR